jgi:DNA-directed RNA polymerase subunit N (RpoN/RPB10)
MPRKEITDELIAKAERLALSGVDPATIAARLGITEYVVRMMFTDRLRWVHLSPPPPTRRHARAPAVDSATIRMIRRMLDVGWLNHTQIAREVGVVPAIVTQVAQGGRDAIDLTEPPLQDGERFVPKPVRCSGCGALLSVLPCRACRIRCGLGPGSCN